MLDGLGRIELTGAMALHHLLDEARAAGMEVEITGAQAQGLLAAPPAARARCADLDRRSALRAAAALVDEVGSRLLGGPPQLA